MIVYIEQDITDVKEGIVLHGCNCQGKMASGVAKAVRKQWPTVYTNYIRLCESITDKKSLLGMAQMVVVSNNPPLFVFNCFTQLYYGNDGRKYASVDAVREALEKIVKFAAAHKIDKIYMPRIGCGLGGLNWDSEVGPIVEQLAADQAGITIYVCDYGN